jgi:hypothetical protein
VTAYRCEACGNKTRFDVYETKRVRAFHHLTLGGEDSVEEEEVLAHSIEKVVCRWCGSSDAITVVHPPVAVAEGGPPDERGGGSAVPQNERTSGDEPGGTR